MGKKQRKQKPRKENTLDENVIPEAVRSALKDIKDQKKKKPLKGLIKKRISVAIQTDDLPPPPQRTQETQTLHPIIRKVAKGTQTVSYTSMVKTFEKEAKKIQRQKPMPKSPKKKYSCNLM